MTQLCRTSHCYNRKYCHRDRWSWPRWRVVYWFVWRPLPQRSGTIDAPVAAPVQVSFDARGVPHIRAASIDDALFTQGYVTAQDRLWQMDSSAPLSPRGDLAEMIGPGALEVRRESRRLRLRRIAEDAYVTLARGRPRRRSRPTPAASTTSSPPISTICPSSSRCWAISRGRGA